MARTHKQRRAAAAATTAALVLGGLAVTATPQAAADDWSRCLAGSDDTQASFARAAAVSGVPEDLLLAVGYLGSRWDQHAGKPSTSGGYGPMHLTLRPDLGAPERAAREGRGDDSVAPQVATGTLAEAAEITGFSERRLRTDPVANICGGAAVLASYQPGTTAQRPAAWTRSVALYAGAADRPTAARYAGQVFEVLRSGEQRTTDTGDRVRLPASPRARLDAGAVKRAGLLEPGMDEVDCPAGLGCEAIPAPYEWYGEPNPGAYGNHDLADRPRDMEIDTIVIHNTEGDWERALELVTDPTYVSWQYSLRSADGHIAQHVDNRQVAWHAGNWYTNMHSIGLEHEGIAAEGSTWFTESVYRTSASLVRHLTEKYDVPRDRAHIIGHDQVPGHNADRVKLMHWDTGPFWDWEHYMELVKAPIDADRGRTNLVTVAPGFDDNQQPVTGCEDDGSCDPQGTNFVYLHTAPDEDAPLVKDAGLSPDGANSTTHVSDIGARAAAGHVFRVAQRRGDWLGVWWLGDVAWLHSPKSDPVVVPTRGKVVVPRGDEAVPVYGRAYPEESAYPEEIPYQPIAPLQYTLGAGQSYALGDRNPSTDYYYAKTFDDSLPGDHTVVKGKDRYHQIWFGHRMAYVRAADVKVVHPRP